MLIRLSQLTFLAVAILGLVALHTPARWLWESNLAVLSAMPGYWIYGNALTLVSVLVAAASLGFTLRAKGVQGYRMAFRGMALLLLLSLLYAPVTLRAVYTGEIAVFTAMAAFLASNGWLAALCVALALHPARRQPSAA